MKADRLIGILSVLMQKGSVTAPYLAERFEVSRRTINRDIADLCAAGIPIVTKQGVGGGLSLMKGYKLGHSELTAYELMEVLTGDKSVDIDLSSWYKPSLAVKIRTVRTAINRRQVLEFDYYSPYGEGRRTIEPYRLVFRWGSWYVWGWDLDKGDYRLFKLNRLEHPAMTDSVFEARDLPEPDFGDDRVFPANIRFRALFQPSEKWRLVEEYGAECFAVQPDGRLLTELDFTNYYNMRQWALSFGEGVEVLEPEELRRDLARVGEIFSEMYAKQDG